MSGLYIRVEYICVFKSISQASKHAFSHRTQSVVLPEACRDKDLFKVIIISRVSSYSGH